MKIGQKIKIFTYFLLIISVNSLFAQEVSENIKNLTNSKLLNWASSPKVIETVKSQNAKGISLDKIKQLDKTWIETSGVSDLMKELLSNSCAEYLKSLQKENNFISEAFVMDNQGANVAMTNKTSDYWQGDEDKFIKSYNNANGQVHYGKVSFDESSQSYLIQVSVPVKEGGKTIGAVTFGLDFEKVK